VVSDRKIENIAKPVASPTPTADPQTYAAPAAAPVINEEKPATKLVFKKPISITSQLSKGKQVEEHNDGGASSINSQQNKPVSAEGLLNAWNKYAAIVKSQSKMTLHTTLTANKPELKDENKIILYINNEVQREDLKIEQTELLGFLKQSLENNNIHIEIVLIEAEQLKKYYTSTDKFKRLSEINPNIVKLKQRFDLEIE
jgi:DNA polymerase III subunit gamma/tau